ncbi:MAG TPA: tryptophan--tRNA ligase, partial [Deinococcales bacterium]|nr:tryptophan--tRNA ligase [Deinococcales bacterium]
AADILAYDTDIVPVGEDQQQHIELTRDLAIRFNNLFGDTFTVPKSEIPEAGARVMGLDDPEAKMSKSLSHRPGHALELLASDKQLRKAVMSAVTDSDRELRYEHASRGVRNLLDLYSALAGVTVAEAEAEFAGEGYGTLKKALAGAVIDTVGPLREEANRLLADEKALDGILAQGAARAREITMPVLRRVKDALGVG